MVTIWSVEVAKNFRSKKNDPKKNFDPKWFDTNFFLAVKNGDQMVS